MEESAVVRKSDAVRFAASIDSAVTSSVRRYLFRDRLKCWSNTLLLSVNYLSSCSFPSVKYLTIRVGRVKFQRLQGLCACLQKESHALHPEEVHVAKTKSAEEGNHVLYKILSRETCEDQPPSQWGY